MLAEAVGSSGGEPGVGRFACSSGRGAAAIWRADRGCVPSRAGRVVCPSRAPLRGLAPHPDALAWFGWHDAAEIAGPVYDDDGSVIRYGGETVLVGPWWMLTLAQSLEYRRVHLQINGSIELCGEAGDPVLAPESWLPIATSEGAGELCLDTAAAAAAPLYVLDRETMHEGMPEQFASLAEFAAAMTRAVEQGHVIPHPHDSRAAMIDASQLPDDLRPLAYW